MSERSTRVRACGVPISMWVRSESRARIEVGAVAWTPPHEVLNAMDTPLLIGVDPCGDTVFNQPQIERQLPREVEYLRDRLASDFHPMLDELERLMGVASVRVHRYLWFLGD